MDSKDKRSYAECTKCKDPISSGKLYEVKGFKWHEQCFACYKCNKPLSSSSNFLTLDNGTLICNDCSDTCIKCHNKIDDLAIILSSNEAYCPNCFVCSKCNNPIKDLRYAKTKNGLFCEDCHSLLLAKRKMLNDQFMEVPGRSIRRPASKNSNIHKHSRSLSGTSSFRDRSNSKTGELEIPAPSHARNMSIDDMLKSTLRSDEFSLDNDDDDNDDDENGINNGSIILKDISKEELVSNNNHSNSNNIHHMDFEAGISEPTSIDSTHSYSRKDIPTKFNSSLLNAPLNSPMLTNSSTRDDSISSQHSYDNSTHFSHIEEEKRGLALNIPSNSSILNSSHSSSSASSSANDKSSLNSGSITRSNTSNNIQTEGKGSVSSTTKVGRSISMKSKNLFSHLRKKSSGSHENNYNHQSSEPDSHLGWGVMNSKMGPHRGVRKVSKGKSDTLIYQNYALPEIEGERDNNVTNQNSHVAMFRTPPLATTAEFRKTNPPPAQPQILLSPDTNKPNVSGDLQPPEMPIGSHYRSNSWQTSSRGYSELEGLEDEISPINKEYHRTELALRKMKLDLKSLEVTRKQLTVDIENLSKSKESLIDEIESLKRERNSIVSQNVTMNRGNTNLRTPVKKNSISSDVSPSIGSNNEDIKYTPSKPKFWKLFGKESSQQPISTASISEPIANYKSSSPFLPATPAVGRSPATPSTQNSGQGSTGPNYSLQDYCIRDHSMVPHLITKCIDFIEKDNLHLRTEGIYRKSGSQVLIEEMERRLADPQALITNKDDVHVVTGVLKRFLRKLNNPLISYEIYKPMINLVRNNELLTHLPIDNGNHNFDDIALVRYVKDNVIELLERLPVENYELLKLLIHHINIVAKFSNFNLMNLHNLAVVFAPSIIHDPSGELDMIDMKERNYIIEFLFVHEKIII